MQAANDSAEPEEPQINHAETQQQPEIFWNPWATKHIDAGESREYHTIPLDDKAQHLLSKTCECGPQHLGERLSNGGEYFPLYLHTSFDMREWDEFWYFNIQHPELGQTEDDIAQ